MLVKTFAVFGKAEAGFKHGITLTQIFGQDFIHPAFAKPVSGKDNLVWLHAFHQHVHHQRCVGQAVDTAFGDTPDLFKRHPALLGNDVGQFGHFRLRHGKIMDHGNRVVFLGDEEFGD